MLKREPTTSQIAKKMKMPVEKVEEIQMWITKKTSLEAPVGEEGESQIGDFIKATGYADTESEIEKFFEKEEVASLLNLVSERERIVLDLRFGVSGGYPHTLAEVAKKLGVSRERVRQIEEAALKKLKRYVKEKQGEF